jgi:DNA-binding MarR family transcriptional regulator
VLHLMSKRGYADLTPAHIAFLANLDCGETHASAIARRMGISRQAVYRTTRELQKLKVLTLEDDPVKGNQKVVRMTPYGTRVVTDARACLAEVEEALRARIGHRDCDRLLAILTRSWGPVLGED